MTTNNGYLSEDNVNRLVDAHIEPLQSPGGVAEDHKAWRSGWRRSRIPRKTPMR